MPTDAETALAAAESAAASATSAAASAQTAANRIINTDQSLAAALSDPNSQSSSALSASFAQVVMPEAFGAAGDGVTDDTAALQAWAVWLCENGGIGRVARDYAHTGTISFTKTGGIGSELPVWVEMVGDLIYTGTGSAVKIGNKRNFGWWGPGQVDITGAGSGSVGIHVAGLWFGNFDSPGVRQAAGTTGILIETSLTGGNDFGSYIIRIANPRLKEGLGAYGIRTMQTTGDVVKVTHLEVDLGWIHSRATAIAFDYTNSAHVRGTALEAGSVGGAGDGIYLTNCADVILTPGETTGFNGWGLNFGAGNSAIRVLNPSRVGEGGSSGWMNTTTYSPAVVDHDRVRLYGSRTNQTYFIELASYNAYGKAAALIISGGGTQHEVLTWADGSPMVLAQRRGYGTQVETTGGKIGFLGATPVVRGAATSDLKDLLVALGLLTDGGATPLNLDNGALTVGAFSGKIQNVGAGGYTATAADHLLIVNTSGVTATLPAASGNTGRQMVVKNISAGDVTVAAASGGVETAGQTVAAGDSKRYVSDGGGTWYVIA